MRIEVRLFATLRSYLPPHSLEGAAVLDVAAGSTVRDVIRSLGIPADFDHVTLIDGCDSRPGSVLREGQILTVYPPLMGGCGDI